MRQGTFLNVNGTLGTENITKIFLVLLHLFTSVRDLVKEFSVAKLANIGLELIKHGNIVAIARSAIEEFKELSPEEAAEVRNKIKEDFDIPDDQLEADLEKIIELLEESYSIGFDAIHAVQTWISFINRLAKKRAFFASKI